MSTITTFVDKQVAQAHIANKIILAQNVIDFAATPVAAADVVQALKIPKGAFVTKVGVYTLTAEGATCTATVGDADGANSWDASANLNSVAAYVSTEGTDAYAPGKVYTAEDTIDLVMGHATDAAKIAVFAEYALIESLQ